MANAKKIRSLSEVVAALEGALPELDDESILEVAQVAFGLMGGDESGGSVNAEMAIGPSAALSRQEAAVCAAMGLDWLRFIARRERGVVNAAMPLSDTERAVCANLGVTPGVFIAARAGRRA